MNPPIKGLKHEIRTQNRPSYPPPPRSTAGWTRRYHDHLYRGLTNTSGVGHLPPTSWQTPPSRLYQPPNALRQNMVFCGKPSKSCEACRKTKTKVRMCILHAKCLRPCYVNRSLSCCAMTNSPRASPTRDVSHGSPALTRYTSGVR